MNYNILKLTKVGTLSLSNGKWADMHAVTESSVSFLIAFSDYLGIVRTCFNSVFHGNKS